jgi:hypothetical protein
MDNTVGTVAITPAPATAGTWAWSANHIWYNYTGAAYATFVSYTLTFSDFRDPALNAATGDLVKTFKTVPAASTVGTVIGRIVDADGDPIEGATVSVDGTSITDTTDANGEFTLSSVPEGDQIVNVSMDGYQGQQVATDVTPSSTTTVPDIVLPKDTTPADWTWLAVIAAIAIIAGAVLATMMYSRHKKAQKKEEADKGESKGSVS